jgi:methionyl-tRNA formyltransferase
VSRPTKIVFAGTPAFAATILKGLVQAHPQALIAAYTQPDRRAGRGLKYQSSPVKVLALAHNIPVYQPQTLRNVHVQAEFAKQSADVLVVAAYGLLLPKPILEAPRFGCINVHPSLLPRWRGAAPIPWAIIAGDRQTGISIMQMNERLDEGPVLLTARCDVLSDDTAQSLHDRLAKLGVDPLLKALAQLQAGTARPRPQDETQATYAPRIDKEGARLDWRRPSNELERQVRAFNPWPVAWTTRDQQPLRVWQASSLEHTAEGDPGMVVACSASGIDVATAKGRLRLLTVQRPGTRPMSVADYLKSRPLRCGAILGAPIHPQLP